MPPSTAPDRHDEPALQVHHLVISHAAVTTLATTLLRVARTAAIGLLLVLAVLLLTAL
ncbi:hypothetical protein RIF23_09490 [Lipingzhangella sp. LS1_29]|uniref:Uncharacterized protein n=1 Tax=Lipingzhangella rawalii TaxID=2055835 RepID=A0ABU2H5G8_9ACTN|nr:hypothetical protein [Lipingzhangella rawalii]MDS1270528.1 hypothetical protein [Lipingzhangella rawalii]